MIKRMLIMLLLVGLLLGAIFAFKQFQASMIKKFTEQMGKMPQTVATDVARTTEWNKNINAVGSCVAVEGVNVSTESAGIIEALYFSSGDEVEMGTLLAKLRVDDEIALLGSLRAEAHLAKLTYDRDIQQLQQNAIAQSVVDLDAANLEKSLALIKQQEAIIQKKHIRAPFTGKLGITPVNVGEYISPGTIIVPLQILDPIYFDFYLPQQDIGFIRIGQSVLVNTNVYPEKSFTGKLKVMNVEIDTSSRNIQVRAILNNPKYELIPGMYGTVSVETDIRHNYITVPITAITYNSYGDTVFIAKKTEDGKLIAEQRFVTVGPSRGDQIAVLEGIKAGEDIIVAGQLKIENNSPIEINNTVLPTNDANPQFTELQ